MTTFIGDYICKIDVKNRLVLPSAFKKQLDAGAQDRFVVKKDIFENCLVLYPMDEWTRQIELIRKNTNPYNRKHNEFIRGLFKNMAELSLDNVNRLLLPKRLTDLVSINKDVVLLGQDEKIEIWSQELYNQMDKGTSEDDFAALAEKIMGGTSNDRIAE
ncbi:MAG: hypothetical protein A2W98_13470 [Bacteroidetes bacterium GWF2_33_38]|nr:MAG: hypothetical protein A2W98_13470 [Bacteroidetes bacterium GWF2_33_38]